MSVYANKTFWLGALDRAVATFAQGALGVLLAGATGILEIDASQLFSVAGLAAAVSVATSIASPGRVIAGDTAQAVEAAKESI